MTTMQQYFDNAQLAQASYALLDRYDFETALKKDEGGFSPREATEFKNTYSVLDPTANPNDAYGFSATLFQRINGGEITLAIRGTEPSADDASGAADLTGADADIPPTKGTGVDLFSLN